MSNFDNMNQVGYNRGNQGWQQPVYPASPYYAPQQPTCNTNIMYVTSPEEALIRTDRRNSDVVYFDQDKNVFYRVRVDMDGRKSWAQFSYNTPNAETTAPATKEDILQLSERITRLEELQESKNIPRKKKPEGGGVANGELDG